MHLTVYTDPKNNKHPSIVSVASTYYSSELFTAKLLQFDRFDKW